MEVYGAGTAGHRPDETVSAAVLIDAAEWPEKTYSTELSAVFPGVYISIEEVL